MNLITKYFVPVAIASVLIAMVNLFGFFRLSANQQMTIFPDDSFYYLMPALNIGLGNGPTADGINITSGYHPLWMGVLSAAAKLTGGNKEALYFFSVSFGALLHSLTALIIFVTAAGICQPHISALLSLMYLLCGTALKESLGGTEVPLLAFLISLFILIETKKEGHRILKGILLGLIFLTRTDSFMFVMFWYLISIGTDLFNGDHGKAIKGLCVSAVFTFFTILPWFLISKMLYGAFFQNSMLMKTLWRERLLLDMPNIQKALYSLSMYREWLTNSSNIYLLFIPLLLVLSGYILHQNSTGIKLPATDTRMKQRFVVCLTALLGYIIFAGVFYSLKFHFVRTWYFAPARLFWPLTGILASALINAYAPSDASKTINKVFSFGLGIVILLNLAISTKNYYAAMPGALEQGNFVTLSEWLNNNTPKNAVVAAYSSGILSYYCERKVINLDGLCNNSIYAVTKSKNLEHYLDKMGVGYIADYDILRFGEVYGLTLDGNAEFVNKRLKEVYRLKCSGKYGDIVILRVLPAENTAEAVK